MTRALFWLLDLAAGAAAGVGAGLLYALWTAWWLHPAWGWFVVPLGLPAVSFLHFAGLVVLAAALTHQVRRSREDGEVDWNAAAVAWLMPPMAWAVMRLLAN